MVYDVQVQLWKNYIQWEKSNPLRSEDTTLITKRGGHISVLIYLLLTSAALV